MRGRAHRYLSQEAQQHLTNDLFHSTELQFITLLCGMWVCGGVVGQCSVDDRVRGVIGPTGSPKHISPSPNL